MLNMVKKLAKALKGITRPNNAAKAQTVVTPAKVLAMPNREELLTRMVGTLQATVDAKVKAFVDAAVEYPFRAEVDEWLDSDGAVPVGMEDLVFSLEALGFVMEDWMWGGYEYDALCAAIEYHKQQGEEFTIELIADVVDTIAYGAYTFFPDAYCDEDLGSEILYAFQNKVKVYELGWLIEAVDYERLGEIWRNEEGGIYTTRGYFKFGKLEF